MNRYGRRLMQQMRHTDPTAYAALRDPEEYFRIRGEELASEIEQLAQAIAGPDRAGESYAEKLSRLNMARRDAESDLMREMLTPDPEDLDRPASDHITLAERETQRILSEDDEDL